MKTEEFDDAIRDKFNTPVPPVSEAELDAVFRNINNRRLVKSNTRWRGYTLFTIAALLFGGLLFWNIRLSTNQQNLATEVKQLNEKIAQTNATKVRGNNTLVQEETTPPITPPSSNIDTKINSTFHTQPSQKLATKRIESESTTLTNKNADNSNNNLVSENTVEPKKQAKIVESKTATDSSLISATESTNNIVQAEESVQKPEIKKPINKIKFIFLTGTSADLSSPFKGINLLEEVQFSKRWSITSGLRYLTFGDELFENEEEYNEKSHEEFKERFKAHIVDSMEIDEIEIHDQFLQIPLLLNYRFPIKNGFDMLISLGGDINIYYKKKVEFVSRPKTQSNFETPVALVEKPDFKTMHDIRLGFGIQKRWNRYTIQLIPEAVYLFNTPNAFVKPFNPGIRIGAFYRI